MVHLNLHLEMLINIETQKDTTLSGILNLWNFLVCLFEFIEGLHVVRSSIYIINTRLLFDLFVCLIVRTILQ